MRSEHTPGPWRVVEGKPIGQTPTMKVLDADGGLIADELVEPDARLIAAAPTMREALENLENDDGSIPEHAWNMVQAAIAKARGPDTSCEACGQPTGDVDVFLCPTCQAEKDEREAGYREDCPEDWWTGPIARNH